MKFQCFDSVGNLAKEVILVSLPKIDKLLREREQVYCQVTIMVLGKVSGNYKKVPVDAVYETEANSDVPHIWRKW